MRKVAGSRSAMQAAQQGIELANSQGNSGLATELQGNVALYREQQPLRDPRLTNGSSSPVKRITGSDKRDRRPDDSPSGVHNRSITIGIYLLLTGLVWPFQSDNPL